MASAVAIFIWGSEGGGESSWTGDVLAVVAGIFFAATLLNQRYVAKRMSANISMLPSACAGSTCSVIVGLVLAGGDVSLVRPESVRLTLSHITLTAPQSMRSIPQCFTIRFGLWHSTAGYWLAAQCCCIPSDLGILLLPK
jgi:hypothetical protein